jgi:hypothetical protein
MLTVFSYSKDVIQQEFVPEKQTVKGKFLYNELIKRLIIRVHRVRLQFQESESWCLLYNNAQAHSSGVVSNFLEKRAIPCVLKLFNLI